MLIVEQKLGQTITINDQIKIKYLKHSKDSVLLGINAPPWMPIHHQLLNERPLPYQTYLARLDAVEPILQELYALVDADYRNLPVSVSVLYAYLELCIESLEVLQALISKLNVTETKTDEH